MSTPVMPESSREDRLSPAPLKGFLNRIHLPQVSADVTEDSEIAADTPTRGRPMVFCAHLGSEDLALLSAPEKHEGLGALCVHLLLSLVACRMRVLGFCLVDQVGCLVWSRVDIRGNGLQLRGLLVFVQNVGPQLTNALDDLGHVFVTIDLRGPWSLEAVMAPQGRVSSTSVGTAARVLPATLVQSSALILIRIKQDYEFGNATHHVYLGWMEDLQCRPGTVVIVNDDRSLTCLTEEA